MTTHREPRDEPDQPSGQIFLTGDGNSETSAPDAAEETAEQVLQDQLDAQLGVLSTAQAQLLRTLSALYHSLAGPQDQLEAAGGLNRPQFPVQPSALGAEAARQQIRVRRMARGG